MSDWRYAQQESDEALAEVRFFSVKKQTPRGELELLITVKEYATPPTGSMRFYAETDKYLNQKTAPFRACGWSDSLLGALSDCLRNIRKFEYEEHEQAGA